MSRLLLDSHIFLWFLRDDPRLPRSIVRTIERTRSVFVSAATVWELSIKVSGGKLAKQPFAQMAAAKGFALLPVLAAHAEAVADLPRHHRDPFDHLLLAQAQVEALTFVTHDRILADYGVPVLLV